jgi:hypothetical protein
VACGWRLRCGVRCVQLCPVWAVPGLRFDNGLCCHVDTWAARRLDCACAEMPRRLRGVSMMCDVCGDRVAETSECDVHAGSFVCGECWHACYTANDGGVSA